MYEANDNYPDTFTIMNVKGNVFKYLSTSSMAGSLICLTYSNFNIIVHVWNIVSLKFVPNKVVNSKYDVVEYPV